jgi:DNA invertase Pin-like site-specific DNA recombinase
VYSSLHAHRRLYPRLLPKGQKTDSQRHKAVQWFEDRESATTMQREVFQKLQAAIFAGQITTMVVWKLDRLARSLKHIANHESHCTTKLYDRRQDEISLNEVEKISI